MEPTVTGTGRVTILALLHTWPDQYCLLAYTSTGHFGDTAVVGHVPVPGHPEVSLMDVAARHAPQRLYGSNEGDGFAQACWLVCVGWSARGTPKPGTADLPATAWTLRRDRTVELGRAMYGHVRVHIGRIQLHDPADRAQAEAVVSRAVAGSARTSTHGER
ncbi:hypothetical protein [Streptomyces sp. TRM64462]|uniref:hypothetical protein n=1 Tax=Streptomyces sp. TRM64462 TaxID=2741726 RepID=UPI001586C72B|nr:hypothetical protein [Streptomyces sp. TRM64462]